MSKILEQVIKECLFEKVKPEDYQLKLASVKEKIEHYKCLRSKTLPIEKDARKKVDTILHNLKAEERHLKNDFKRSLKPKHQSLAKKYSGIQLTHALKWRNEKGLPKLAIFRLDNQVIRIIGLNGSYRERREFSLFFTGSKVGLIGSLIIAFFLLIRGTSHEYTRAILMGLIAISGLGAYAGLFYKLFGGILYPRMPKIIVDCFKDLVKENRLNYIEYSFTGFIPTTVKEKINDAKKVFGRKNIFLVADAENCVRKIVKADPLIVGLKDSRFYLIDTFDLTLIEEAVKEEFTNIK